MAKKERRINKEIIKKREIKFKKSMALAHKDE